MPDTLTPIVVFVPGRPAPQGSKRYLGQRTGKAVLVESSKAVAPWRADVRDTHPSHGHGGRFPGPLPGPVRVTLAFVLARPKNHYRTGRNAHLLRDTAPGLPAGKPDLDKLVRAVLDAIGSAGIWGDDAQVTGLDASKRHAEPGETTGCHITITSVP